MKKKLSVFIAIWVSLFLFIALFGCAAEEKELYGSSIQMEGDSNMRVVFRAEKSKIKIGDDLKVQVFFGPVNDYGFLENFILEDYTATFQMDSDAYVIEKKNFDPIEVVFSKELHDFPDCFYDWNTDAEQSKGVEEIVISGESFVAQAGGFSWTVTVSLHYSDTNGRGYEQFELGSVSLYYLKQKDEILLFGKATEFKKHIKS